jgi:nucleoside-diphosphate-sugar epimerase
MAGKTISILGCGWLGLPLGEQLVLAGYSVKGSTTSAGKLKVLQQKGIDGYELRLNPEPEGDVAALLNADTLLINVPPKAGKMGDDFHPQQIRSLVSAVRNSPIKHVIYVSSTSVYPENSSVARESDVTALDQTSAPALFQAEMLVQSLAPERLVTVLRCGGLMGYDRIPGKYIAGRQVDSGAVPVNYLHRDDAIGILTHLINEPRPGVFNAVAPQHPDREAIYRKSCTDFGYALPSFTVPSQPVPYKIISPEKLVQATDYQFLYPDPLQFLYLK